MGDAVSAELTALLTRLGELADAPAEDASVSEAGVSDAARIDRIALYERARGALAAAQHTEMVAFARSQVATHTEQIAAGRLDPRTLGAGIADQIALAVHLAPFTGSRRLGVARALATDLPNTRALLAGGRLSEPGAEKVVSLTSHLEPEARRLADKQLAETELEDQGLREAEATITKRAYEADPAGFTARGRTARADRRVTLRPAPDTMSVLSGLLPVEQGVACLAALRTHTDTLVATGDGRTRDQIMADTLVERLTGQTTATDVNVEVGIVLPSTPCSTPTAPPPARSSATARCRSGSCATYWRAPRASGGGGGCSPTPPTTP